jgi:DNA sulfur modification protein DndB
VKRRYIPALKGRFGDWAYYTCIMRVSEVVKRVTYAEELYGNPALSAMVQRALKGPRSNRIAQYLIENEERFFNSLVIAVVGGDPSWHGLTEFRPQGYDFDPARIPPEFRDKLGFLSFDGTEKMFALDGQHRLSGMQIATGRRAKVLDDYISLLFVSHRDTQSGRIRTRNLFTTLNRTAIPINRLERIALAENDAMAITARYLVEEHPFFCGQRILMHATDNLPRDDLQHLTTIGNLYEVLTTLFSRINRAGTRTKLQLERPEDENIAKLKNHSVEFFEQLGYAFPPLREFFLAKNAAEVVRRYRSGSGGHIAFRPVGLRIIAEVIAGLVDDGIRLEESIARMARLPTALGDSPFRDVIWLPDQRRMNPARRPLARQLLLHMLHSTSGVPDDLQERYARQLGIPAEEVVLPEPVI